MIDKFWGLMIYLIECGFILMLFLGMVYIVLSLVLGIVGIFV